MSDYVPKFEDGSPITSTTSAAVVGGELLAVSGDGTVAKTSGATTAWVGVAAFDAASGEKVTIHKGGVQRLTASGGITAGAQVISAADGKVASLAAAAAGDAADVNAARQVVGTALTTATDGNPVEIDMDR